MKKIYHSIRIIALVAICSALPSLVKAQAVPNMYYNIDWQINSPVGNSFANTTSGWGAHAEAGYFVTPNVSVGGFLSFHTNNKYIERQTIQLDESSELTSDQQHSIFQIPFGAALRYTFAQSAGFEPYVGLKLGANYSEVSSTLNIFEIYDRQWGFYTGPELGLNFYPNPEKKIGIHLAAYYNYSTNKSEVLSYTVNGLNNWGIRLGVAF